VGPDLLGESAAQARGENRAPGAGVGERFHGVDAVAGGLKVDDGGRSQAAPGNSPPAKSVQNAIGGQVDNTQFSTMMVALDNQTAYLDNVSISLDNVVHAAANISYQMDLLYGVIFALVFVTAYRWHL